MKAMLPLSPLYGNYRQHSALRLFIWTKGFSFMQEVTGCIPPE